MEKRTIYFNRDQMNALLVSMLEAKKENIVEVTQELDNVLVS